MGLNKPTSGHLVYRETVYEEEGSNSKMRTRKQSRRPENAPGSGDVLMGMHDTKSRSPKAQHDQNTATNLREAIGQSPKRAGSHKLSQKNRQEGDTLHGGLNDKTDGMIEENGKKKAKAELISNATVAGSGDAGGKTPLEGKERTVKHALSAEREDMDETDWQDGSISISDLRQDSSTIMEGGLTVEFSEPLPSTTRKVIKRASAEDKELAELVHKAHLLCLLARGRLVDGACDDPLIQASLLSLVPSNLLYTSKIQKLTANTLIPLVNWFSDNFHVRSSCISERSFKACLVHALETREGTAEEVAALSVALFRALNLTTRFVSVLDVAPLKPAPDMFCSNQEMNGVSTGISSNNSMNAALIQNQASASASEHSGQESPQTQGFQTRENDLCCKIPHSRDWPATVPLNDRMLEESARDPCHDSNEACGMKNAERTKRKGDIEFELQLEMALNATAAGVCESDLGLDFNNGHGSSPSPSCRSKTAKRVRINEQLASAQGSSMAVWSRKLGPPLYWAEVFCSGENLTGRWVHIDSANAVIDGEQKVEAAAAACRRSLRYVVAFAGNGAKDVTRRYCTKWYTVSSQRINPLWWNAVLLPLKELESQATGGVVSFEAHCKNPSSEVEKLKAPDVPGFPQAHSSEATRSYSSQGYVPDCVELTKGFDMEAAKPQMRNIDTGSCDHISGISDRSSLEDMELETRALTEPLPTNQQAYKNHHLYAIERWLSKYQILHPKGPVLGYCSGHPVYPRSCVQTLQTKQRWLWDGLQIKANESPAKVVKRSHKFNKVQTSDPDVCDEEDAQDTIKLYGKWQTERLSLPHAVNGIVPKNERGQVDVWSEKCLPPGTVHLRLPRLVPVVKRLEIDFAPAMVGFEFHNGRSVPIFEGVVVCTEFRDAIMEAYAEEEERREADEKKREEARALSRWYQLLCNIVTRQRLKDSYECGSSSIKDEANQQTSDICRAQVEDDGRQNQSHVKNSQSDYQPAEFSHDHEHIFPMENQSFDEDSSIRTKRCPCGFSVQVEEM